MEILPDVVGWMAAAPRCDFKSFVTEPSRTAVRGPDLPSSCCDSPARPLRAAFQVAYAWADPIEWSVVCCRESSQRYRSWVGMASASPLSLPAQETCVCISVGTYDVVIEEGLLASIPARVHKLVPASRYTYLYLIMFVHVLKFRGCLLGEIVITDRYVILSDDNVAPLYAQPLLEGFTALKLNAFLKVIPSGKIRHLSVPELPRRTDHGRWAVGGGLWGPFIKSSSSIIHQS